MTERLPKSVLLGAAVLAPLILTLFAFFRPGYFTNEKYLGGLLLAECLLAALWCFREFFFPIVLLAFLLAGVNLPVGSVWAALRWVFLGLGACAGVVIVLKDRRHDFGLFHGVALFCVFAASLSAAVSRYPTFAFLKAASLLLLFVYAATGARLAVRGRENQFFGGLLTGCEFFVVILAALYLSGIEAMGNPNSLGAVMGVVAAPILLWGSLVGESSRIRHRRLVLFAVSLLLVFHSHARASMVAAAISCGLLCLALRKYKLLGLGVGICVIFVATAAIVKPEVFSNTVTSVTSSVLYKGKDPARGLLESRTSPWQGAMNSIHDHLWFGSGFGTTDTGRDAVARLGTFASNLGVSAENGSSYLTIVTWVGIAGVLPFLALVAVLIQKIFSTLTWMLRTADPMHPAVPLALVTIAGLIHAGFEDWLFAPGYYLCVFFWSMAFVLVDFAPRSPEGAFAFGWRLRSIRQQVAGVAPGP
jgi:hypothetical protein